MILRSRLLQPRKAREVGTAIATELEYSVPLAGASKQVHQSWRERIAAPTFVTAIQRARTRLDPECHHPYRDARNGSQAERYARSVTFGV